LMVIAAHVALVATVMSIRMDFPQALIDPPTQVDLIPAPKPTPTPDRVEPRNPQPQESVIDRTDPFVPMPSDSGPAVDSTPVPFPSFGDLVGPGTDPAPKPTPAPVKVEARLLTSGDDLRPPYPTSKLLNEEEAVLQLRLTIDERGHVVAVDPVGDADRVFVNAARRHLIMKWRYRPATEDGHAVLSRLFITLRFQLEN
jgi:periplasmic protein TonB